jgi:hypothetical protein
VARRDRPGGQATADAQLCLGRVGDQPHRHGEFIALCRRVNAEPFFCVNFLSDGEKRYAARSGDAKEAAAWVRYSKPKLWQIGNETSYGTACFTRAA